MSKTERVRAIQIPRVVESDGTLHGSLLAHGTVPAAALDISALADISVNLGSIQTGELRLGGPLASYILLTNTPYLRMEMTTQKGIPFFQARLDEPVALSLGTIPQGREQHPLTVDEDGHLTLQAWAIVAGQRASTLLTGDYIWIGTEKTPLSHPGDPEVQGVFLGDDGLLGYRGGQAQAGLTTSGRIVAGQRGQTMMDRDGLWSLVNESFSPGESDVGHRFLDADGNVVGGVILDANLVQGQAYLDLFARPTERFPYVEANLLAFSSYGIPGGVYVSAGSRGKTVEIKGVDHITLEAESINITSFYDVNINHPFEGTGMGYLYARLILSIWPHFPHVAEALRKGELYIAQEGGQTRLYMRGEDGLYWFEPDGVTT